MPQFYAAARPGPGFSLTARSANAHYRGMSRIPLPLTALALAFPATVLAAGDYVGVLRPTARPTAIAIPEPGLYWPLAGPFGGGLVPAFGQESFRMKLGYRYSKYFSVETGYSDAGPQSAAEPFSGAFARGRGFSLETVGTLPLWRHASLYGRLGAWRNTGGFSLLTGGDGSHRPGAGLNYGLGFKYDVTRRFGLKAEMERFSPLDRWGTREGDSDNFSVGVTWRF